MNYFFSLLFLLSLVMPIHASGESQIEIQVPAEAKLSTNDKLGSVEVVNKNGLLILVEVALKPHSEIKELKAFNLHALKQNYREIERIAVQPSEPIIIENLNEIGKGAQNRVYQFGDRVLRPFHPNDEYSAMALLKMLSLQDIPGVVKIEQILRCSNGEIGVVFEKLERRDFSYGKVSERDFSKIIISLIETLKDLHKRNTYHGDLTHAYNWMFRGDHPVLIDLVGDFSDHMDTAAEIQQTERREIKRIVNLLLDLRLANYFNRKIIELVPEIYKIFPSKEAPDSLWSFIFGKPPTSGEENPVCLFFSSAQIWVPIYIHQANYNNADTFSPALHYLLYWKESSLYPELYVWYKELLRNLRNNDHVTPSKNIHDMARELDYGYHSNCDRFRSLSRRIDPLSKSLESVVQAVFTTKEALLGSRQKELRTRADIMVANLGNTQTLLVEFKQGKIDENKLMAGLNAIAHKDDL